MISAILTLIAVAVFCYKVCNNKAAKDERIRKQTREELPKSIYESNQRLMEEMGMKKL